MEADVNRISFLIGNPIEELYIGGYTLFGEEED